MTLPDLIFVGGKKRSGKDFLCDQLVKERGYHKAHIVEAWLRQWFAARGLEPDEWEMLKAQYRAEIQADAEVARAANPRCLLDSFAELLPTFPRPLCVTAIRFVNEAQFGMNLGALVIRVQTPDTERARRFLAAGESLAMLDDPFEREIDQMPVHLELPGTQPAEWYVPAIEGLYETLCDAEAIAEMLRRAA